MKNILVYLLLGLIIFGCQEEPCPTPVCAPPNINSSAILKLQFCIGPEGSPCFSDQELEEVYFTVKEISTDKIVRKDTLDDLSAMNNTITIGEGLGIYDFGPEPYGANVLDRVEYYYEIQLPFAGLFYTISNFKFESNTDPCTCPDYNFESVTVNEILTFLVESGGVLLILK
ncbi:MAG: hypothetical protein DWQ02_07480 [Bacteroidetes bacterium]|nr:MAG: hypothetical protein DWQ02_07480 [Bacteroidota bacterium]